MIRSRKHNRAFTLIELLVCITIFVVMTALLLAKYGNFNQSVLLTNLAYETALQIRTAQNYGLSVKAAKGSGSVCASPDSGAFQCAYGIEFDTSSGNNTRFILFSHSLTNGSNSYQPGNDSIITTYTLKRGAIISSFCVVSCVSVFSNYYGKLDIIFKRPDPSALIYYSGSPDIVQSYAQIRISGTDGSLRLVSVRDNGQISVDKI